MGRRPTVGVITLDGNYNYGNRLQLWAAMALWRRAGCDPTNLRLRLEHGVLAHPRQLVRRALGRGPAPNGPEGASTPGRLAAFARFGELIPVEDVSSPETGLASQYDLLSVGSDQVWNPTSMTGGSGSAFRRAYCRVFDGRACRREADWRALAFARPEQRVALSASIGMDELEPWQVRRLRPLRGIGRISVRERRAAELLREHLGIEARVLCDPTFAIPDDEWRAVADGRCTPRTPYVLTYLLGGLSAEAEAVLRRVTDGGRVPVVALSDRQAPGEPDAGPAEFVHLVDHAAFVVTDSFHASVFSVLMGTPLAITHRKGSLSYMFGRLESLADTYGLWKNVCGSEELDLSVAGDYSEAQAPIERGRVRMLEFLGEAARSVTAEAGTRG